METGVAVIPDATGIGIVMAEEGKETKGDVDLALGQSPRANLRGRKLRKNPLLLLVLKPTDC